MNAEDVLRLIDEGYENQPEKRARDYIGASAIGNPCGAYLAFNLRGFPNSKAPPRLKRIFALGHLLEDRAIKDLTDKADVRVWAVDGLTGRQFAYEAWGGHISCHADGQIEMGDELMLLEIKTMNEASWSKFKNGKLRYSHPTYYAQVQMLMGMSGFTRTFVLAINKNTSAYHAEIVEFDPIEASYIEARVETVLRGEATKIADDETDWRCKGCGKFGVCWKDMEVPKECRTCAFASPRPDGTFHCTKHNRAALASCDSWQRFQPRNRT